MRRKNEDVHCRVELIEVVPHSEKTHAHCFGLFYGFAREGVRLVWVLMTRNEDHIAIVEASGCVEELGISLLLDEPAHHANHYSIGSYPKRPASRGSLSV